MLFMPDIQSFNMQQIPVLSTSLFTSNLEMSGNEKAVARPGLDWTGLLFSKGLPRYSSARSYAGQAGRGDTGVVSYSGSWSFHDWAPKLERL